MHSIYKIKHLIWYVSTGQTHKGLSRERPTQQKMVGDMEEKSHFISSTIISLVFFFIRYSY